MTKPALSLVFLFAVGCGNDDVTQPEDPYAFTRDDDAIVTPGAIYEPCQTDADCVMVDATCNGCCTVTAIASSLRERYADAKADACRGYQGAICDCSPSTLVAACVANRCTGVPPTR